MTARSLARTEAPPRAATWPSMRLDDKPRARRRFALSEAAPMPVGTAREGASG